MIKNVTAIITAAACAGVMVTFVPGFAPEVAAGASQPVERSVAAVTAVSRPAEVIAPGTAAIRNAVEQNIPGGGGDRKIVCAQSWPYYERSCLRDGRQADGNARLVRVIALDRSAAIRHRPRR